MIEFTVYGTPVSRGSKTPWIPRHKDGSPVTKNGRIVIATMDSAKRSKSWMNDVRAAAAARYRGELLAGPVKLTVLFYLPRPKSHFGTGRNADVLKDSAPREHSQKPDLDKLIRAVADSLRAVIWRDDSQVCEIAGYKAWTRTAARAEITVEEVPTASLDLLKCRDAEVSPSASLNLRS